ncbi:cupredoxin domain-containing protein [Cohnella algarum]|uniref:cupredoxin domain-containing protein n=1 Tax=Cohnella algarum TaxID=2044859 RepID=UPI0019684187|nr:cupredoxin domain-containing protein [Cohnella algarum]MBN2980796.1 cupredoxin domain-containing protein [Cohnella algarum]
MAARKWGLTAAVWTMAAALLLAGCGGGEDRKANAPADDSAPSASSAAASDVKAVTIKASNFKFDQPEIRVAKGQTIELTLENEQGNHTLKIDGYEQTVKAGKTISFTADQAGEFEFYCDLMCGTGHADMVGKLIVE